LILDIKADIAAVKGVGVENYGVFTYESLLNQTGFKKLSKVKEKVDW